MELALYAPGLGYYATNVPLGPAGDFVTAPEIGVLFGRCVARQCEEILQAVDGAEIIEFGAGSGRLAVQILREIAVRGSLPKRYRIIELSPSLRERQFETVSSLAPELLDRVQWADVLPDTPVHGVVIANEVLDAMPVTRFRVTARGLRRLRVGYEESGFHIICGDSAGDEPSLPCPAGLADLPVGYESEINEQAAAWVRSVGAVLGRGVMLLVDYGFPAHEFYHRDRAQGTLMCHQRHRIQPDPLVAVGAQDITAHIDFTAMARAGQEAGLELLGYTQLAPFLLSLGLLDFVPVVGDTDPREVLAVTAEIKKLTLPSEMGELFKVMALGRGVGAPLTGFIMQDHRARLGGGAPA